MFASADQEFPAAAVVPVVPVVVLAVVLLGGRRHVVEEHADAVLGRIVPVLSHVSRPQRQLAHVASLQMLLESFLFLRLQRQLAVAYVVGKPQSAAASSLAAERPSWRYYVVGVVILRDDGEIKQEYILTERSSSTTVERI